ncbi:hypothetical protein [Methylobacterium sp. J-076]|uniref:hypothetical protein n=1 Tax=Methylobacterium sp. J-076 TaxID=2836655 RepID=UPI001FB8AECA|nr:hypothetical protein [Methylobacterium sp. J-076]MCJ2012802.1 hypothetical protein [Methylobacterium sp. J-076]
MSVFRRQTVGDWQKTGHRGLRIPRCPTCRATTWASWGQLCAGAEEDVVAVAQRLRCIACGEAPAGLPIVASTSPAVQ